MRQNNSSEKEEEMKQNNSSFLGTFISRPVLSWVINIVITLVGIVSWYKLAVRELPKMDFPTITVTTEYSGASPAMVESQVTVPLEESFAGIEGIDFIQSASTNSQSRITIQFKSDRNMDAASADVRDRIMRTKDSLPQGLRDPTMSKSSSSSGYLVQLAATGPKYNMAEIGDYMQRYAKGILESVSGVASVSISGLGSDDSGSFQIHAYLNPEKLSAYDLTIREVREAIGQQSFKSPLGDVIQNEQAFTSTLNQAITSIEGYSDVFIKEYKKGLVRLKDVATMELVTDDPDSIVRYNGNPAVAIYISAQQTANPMQVAAEINAKLPEIRNSLPKDLKLDVVSDRSEPIQKSIKSVYSSLIEAILCVFFVMLFFLRSWRATFIPMITIPICVFGGFFILYIANFSINTLTLLALVLAIGLVVDDAIVVLENIYRYVEKGMDPLKAAFAGVREIQFAVIAMTLTLMAVYAPITLSSGMVGKLFTEFAITLAGTVLISGLVALVLTPMLCSRILKHEEPVVTGWQSWSSNFLKKIDMWYSKALDFSIERARFIIISCVVFGLVGFGSLFALPRFLFPDLDMNMIILEAQGPSGATAEYVNTYLKKVEAEVKKIPELKNYLLSIQSKSGRDSILLRLVNPEDRRRTCAQVLEEITKKINPVQSGLDIHGRCISGVLGGSDSDDSVSFVIQSQKSYDEMELLVRRILGTVRTHPGVGQRIMTSRVAPEKAFDVTIDRERAANLGIRMHEVGEMLSFALRGQPPADRFERDGKRYPMRVWVDRELRKDPYNLMKFHVRSSKGSENQEPPLVSLRELLKISEIKERPLIAHYEGMRSYSISFDINSGYGVVDVYRDVEEVLKNTLPIGYKYSPTGQLRQTINEGNNVILVFALAILFIFLIMAAQFESFLDPLMIMFTVPLALAGGILILFLVPEASMNIFTQIALITLIGLITKHGILMIDFANKLFDEKKDRTVENVVESIKKACVLRLRPILMTTAAMVLGAIPLALSGGNGHEIRNQIGWVIVGGMSVGTFFTLFLVPCLYVFVRSRIMRKPII